MRRVLATGAVLAVTGGGWLALTGAGEEAGAGGTVRVDAIFDNAGFLIPGQDVKIAGAKVGSVADVTLTRDNKARIHMDVHDEFAPFRSDASCTIQPQSLIGEKFVQCTPGTPKGRPLVARGDTAPTIPVTNTRAPVDPDLLAATFRSPTIERLAIVLNELGSGLAARGADLNAVIRRANPALHEANRVLRIVERDRRRIRSLVASSDRVIGELARKRGRVQEVLDRGADVAEATARERENLERTIAGLPPLLTEAEPALRDLAGFARDTEPVLADVQRAAPTLRRLARDFGPLADAARPALDRLGTASVVGEDALKALRPVVTDLRRFARAARPTADLLETLLADLPRRGVVEGLLTFAFNGALATSRFDATSHILPSFIVGTQCGFYATTTSEHCSALFASKGARDAKRRATRRERPRPAAERPQPAPAPAAPATPAPAPADPPKKPLEELPKQVLEDLPKALEELLPGVGELLDPDGRGQSRESLTEALDFLLR